ncbi:type I restriction endonuclease subunit R [uncultured Sunxiuqinia sp.]|uniref:type I restriction endonuclease subunit R n=1 Tax=uncultured Sunxiuqinia sp. TaxID=1573825 RepID=UPI002AA6D3F5|nr:type I restriction endonuclease subunit R [uncultured Sunxiuqinia sp.]
MVSQTNEQALEAAIEKELTGYSQEELKTNQVSEPQELYRAGNGFYMGSANDFDAKYAIDETRFWHFLENTQKEELEKLQRSSDWKLKILERFDRMVKKYGLLRILRKGLEVEDAFFTLLYPMPLASSGQIAKDNFESNEFSVTRQIRYNQENLREEIDMVVFVNGLPIATLELKNHWTGQNAKVHGIKQYKYDRDTKQPLLNFGRCLVHFAVDTDEVYMCTKLNGGSSFFLPFNKGNNHGKGNPPNPFGHETSYLWEVVFTRQSLANIIQHFVRFDGKPNDALNKRTLFFPRYHQMDVVRKILADASKKGVGQTYLIQHSAGSGKSNSITWAAYQLIETYPESATTQGAKSIDAPLFDSVIVVTDRRLLDKQLRENIKEFSEVKNIVAPAFSSRELQTSLEQGKKIIITTIQKFPFIVDGIADLSDKRFAVIIDEAHSSQSGTAAGKMNQAMGMAQEEEEDAQDKILKAMQARKMKGNASYLAFTATPKNATLERFGNKQEDGSYKPFHLYSMKQAIEEGFILDVLANYTTYKSYYEIEKSIEDNPLFDTKKAQKKLRAYVERDKRTIATKAEIMMEHFTSKIFNTKKLKAKAKGMVVTQNIESAIRYYQALKKILQEKGNPFKIAIAFSGKKIVDGIEYTEAELNGFAEKDTRDKFAEDEYRILVVANKYLTGFDQPKLCTMYVDKKLQGVLAVQALSRLNRAADKLGKKTEDLFILDFFNQVDDIKASFDPFYTSTTLSKATDVNVLHELKATLADVGVYEWSEVEQFVEKYFEGVDAQQLSPIIDVAANRFNQELELEDDQKADFKIKAKQFVKIYSQMASIMPYEVLDWEKLFWFLKFLIPKLIVISKDDELIDELLESVDLSTYGLERTKVNQSIGLDDSETELDPQNPNPRSSHGGDELVDPLDEIIRTFNERFYSGWEETPEEARVKYISIAKNVMAHPDFKNKVAQNTDKQNSDLALKKIMDEIMLNRRKANVEEYKRYAKDDAYYQGIFDLMKRMIDNPSMIIL